MSDAPALPAWAREIIDLYRSHTASQFILHGNIEDTLVLPSATPGHPSTTGSLHDFFLHILMPGFDVILSYDIGNGLRVEKGGDIFARWPALKDHPVPPREPRAAVEYLTRYFRYSANLARIQGGHAPQTGCIIRSAHLLAPAVSGGWNHDLNALALLIRDWAADSTLSGSRLATCLLTPNLHDLHPILPANPRTARVKIPLPGPEDTTPALVALAQAHPAVLDPWKEQLPRLANELRGATLHSIETLVRLKASRNQPLLPADVTAERKRLVEEECQDLIEFIPPEKSLDLVQGFEPVKEHFLQDIELWQRGETAALPMGYLLCGPVGTGKTFLVECLAGQAGVPVVKIRNFRDRWVGGTESNLEKIFRLLQALGRCYVFIDEADQALGRREGAAHDGGLSGRVYSMMAKEMGNPDNRGRIVWVLASSRPDLIEIDLKRPGRIDVKIPLLPCSSPAEAWELLAALCRRKKICVEDSHRDALLPLMPEWLTAGTAESIATRAYRLTRTRDLPPADALRSILEEFQNPVPRHVLETQIRLAIDEATATDLIPPAFRSGSFPPPPMA